MAGAASKQVGRNRWLIGAGWMAGVSIILVEMQVGVDYVQASVVEHARMVAGWLPMIGTLLCRFIGSLAPHPQGLASVTRLMLLAAMPVALVVTGCVLKSRATE